MDELTRNDIIAEARKAGMRDDYLMYDGPGRCELNADRQLAETLAFMLDSGAEDASSGDVESPTGHFARIERWLVVTDHVGFIHVTEFDTRAGAICRFDEREREYAEWSDEG